MYVVEWCDKEGNLHEWEYKNLLDAMAEYEFLEQRFDGVCIKRRQPNLCIK